MFVKKYLTCRTVAESLGITSRTVRNWIDDGVFPNAFLTSKTGGGWRIPEQDIDNLQKNLEKRGKARKT